MSEFLPVIPSPEFIEEGRNLILFEIASLLSVARNDSLFHRKERSE